MASDSWDRPIEEDRGMGRSFPMGLAAIVSLGGTPATSQQPVAGFTPAGILWGDGPALLPRGVKTAGPQGSPA
jgi:hypothetical protein